MEGGSQPHRVNHHLNAVVELKPYDFQRIPRVVRTDREHSWWVHVWLKLDDCDRMFDRMENRLLVESVFVCRTVELHRILTYYEISV